MIKIRVIYRNRFLYKIIIDGHAMYDDYGKDIVCAAVSATYLCTVNGIFALNSESISVNNENNKHIVKVVLQDEVIITLLQNMINCFISLEEQYPKNIKLVKEEE